MFSINLKKLNKKKIILPTFNYLTRIKYGFDSLTFSKFWN